MFTFKGNETREVPTQWPSGTSPEDHKKALRDFPDPIAVPYRNSPNYQFAKQKKVFVGLLAQEAEEAFPRTVSRSKGYIDGREVDDLREFDASEITYGLINAIRELNDLVTSLRSDVDRLTSQQH